MQRETSAMFSNKQTNIKCMGLTPEYARLTPEYAHWNTKAGANDDTQRRLERMFRSKSMMAWSEVLRDAILAKIELHSDEDRAMPFYRKLSDQQAEQIKKIVSRLVTWKGWQAPKDDEIDRVMADNKSEVKDWFRKKGLDTGYLMGATE